MNITRNINGANEVIELTSEEIHRAYQIQEKAYCHAEISLAIACLNDGSEAQIDENKVLESEELCATIFKHYNDYQKNGDGERWSHIVSENVPDEYYIPRF